MDQEQANVHPMPVLTETITLREVVLRKEHVRRVVVPARGVIGKMNRAVSWLRIPQFLVREADQVVHIARPVVRAVGEDPGRIISVVVVEAGVNDLEGVGLDEILGSDRSKIVRRGHARGGRM